MWPLNPLTTLRTPRRGNSFHSWDKSGERRPCLRFACVTPETCRLQHKPHALAFPRASLAAFPLPKHLAASVFITALYACARNSCWRRQFLSPDCAAFRVRSKRIIPRPAGLKHVAMRKAYRLHQVSNTTFCNAHSRYPYKCLTDLAKNSKCFS